MSNANRYTGLVDRYRDRLPVSATTRAISLGEGNTPLIKLENIPRIIGKDVEIYVKYEGLNPTGSFKDRGMTMAVTKAVEEGSKAIICASTGNTSAAAAAYAARAGISIDAIMQQPRLSKDLIPIVILTDPVKESKMDAALSQIQALPVIHGEIVRIRLESLDN